MLSDAAGALSLPLSFFISSTRQESITATPKHERRRISFARDDTMKNRLSMRAAVLVVVMGILPGVLGEKGLYRLRSPVKDEVRRKVQVAEPLSFSGDLDPIIDAANQLADEEEALNAGTTVAPPGATTADGTLPSDTSIGCDTNSASSQPIYLFFTYEMETLPAPVDDRDIILQDETDVVASLEKALNTALADKLLYCPGLGYDASGDNTGIVEFDSSPSDEPIPDKSCNTTIDPANTCQVMEGQMKVVYTNDTTNADIVEYMVMTATRDFLNGDVNVPGLARTEYLGPAITNPNGATDGGETPSNGVSTDTTSGLSTRSIIFMSVASAGLIAAVGLVTFLRMRKRSSEEEVPYVATLENESSGEESPSRLDSSNEDSNFSSIMPSNYRLDVSESLFNSIASPSFGQSSMGTIHESDDANSEGQRSDDILVSDGYTTEGDSSTEFPYAFGNNYVANATPVLGARPRTVSLA